MPKATAALIMCTALLIACTHGQLHGVAHTFNYTGGNEAELKDGARRINDFKQELLSGGLSVVSNGVLTSSSGGDNGKVVPGGRKETVVLKGSYGKLRDVEITLWTSDRLTMEAPQMGAGVKTQISNQAEEDEFNSLKERLQLVVSGPK